MSRPAPVRAGRCASAPRPVRRRRGPVFGFLPCAAAVAALALLAAPSAPPPPAAAQDSPQEFEKALEKINAEIRDLKARIASEEKRESTALAELERVEMGRTLLRNELAAETLLARKIEADRTAYRSRADALRARIDRERAGIKTTLVTLYKFGRLDVLRFALNSASVDALFGQSRRLALLARYEEANIAAFVEDLQAFAAVQADLEKASAEAAARIRAAEAKRAELAAQEARAQDLVRRIQTSREMNLQTLGELNDRAARLQDLMRKIAESSAVLPTPFAPLYELKGRLPWPVEGKVLTRFGPQRHPRFDTIVMNNGIEIAPRAEPAEARAVHGGRVAFADEFEGYGRLVIVDHGLSYYTLYGHCRQFLAAKGDLVRAGQPLAIVGDTGSLKGTCLYFEVRSKTKALDPLQWLRGMVK